MFDLFEETEQPDWKQEIKYLSQVSGLNLSWLNNKDFKAVLSIDDLEEMFEDLRTKDMYFVDTETTGVLFTDKVVSVQICAEKGKAYFVPVRMNSCQNIDPKELAKKLKPLFENKSKTIVCFNAKFDGKMLRNLVVQGTGVDIFKSTIIDLQICFKLKDPDQKLTLKILTKKILGLDQLELEHLFKKVGSAKRVIAFPSLQLSHAIPYACSDVEVMYNIYEKAKDKLNLEDSIVQLEHKVQRIIADMECRGLYVNKSLLAKAEKACIAEIERLDEMIKKQAGKDFKVNSNVDMANYLYGTLGLKVLLTTDKGAPAVSKEALEPYKETVPFVDWVLKYKEASKLLKAFIQKIPEYCDATSSVHPNFNHLGAASGRFSCTDPNFQQLPKQRGSDLDFRSSIRQAVQAREGYIIFDMDFSQIEYRVFASLAGDENLKKAYEDGLDFHQATAAMVYGVPYEEVTKLQRINAKTINFGLLYGLSSYSLAQRLGISEAEAEEMKESYFENKPRVREWTEEVHELAKKHGYIKTYFGRKRLLRELYSKDKSTYAQGLRKSVNSTVQGAAADILKIAFVRLDKVIKENNLDVYMIATVHDEIVFEVGLNQDLRRVFKLLQDAMEVQVEGWVPILASPEAAFNWGSMVDVDENFPFDDIESLRNHDLEDTTSSKQDSVETITLILPEGMSKIAFQSFKDKLQRHPGDEQVLVAQGSGRPKLIKSTIEVTKSLVDDFEDLNIKVLLPERLLSNLM